MACVGPSSPGRFHLTQREGRFPESVLGPYFSGKLELFKAEEGRCAHLRMA